MRENSLTKPLEKALFWIGGAVFLLVFLSLISSILLPFIVGLLAAYFLDPAADKLEQWGLSRVLATVVIIVLFFAIVITIGVILVPLLYEQFSTLIGNIPGYAAQLQEKYGAFLTKFLKSVDPDATEKAKAAAGDISGYLLSFSADLVKNVWQSGMAILNLFSLVFISPVVSFYMLRDWDKIVTKIDSWLPKKSADTIREQFALIDETLSGYIRGQSNVCIFLGVFYAIGLSLVGLDFGLFIGLGTGLLAFIPYAGAFFGMAMGLGVAFFQFGDMTNIVMVLGVFLVGQIIEGNFITPKLVGEKVGLHAVWIIFGLLAGGALFGFTGVLIAIPVTAVIGVLSRFALSQYLKGELYSGGKIIKKKTVKATKKATTKAISEAKTVKK